MSDDMRPYWPGAFKVGDRVRVRLSLECRSVFEAYQPNGAFVRKQQGHDSNEDGKTGVLVAPVDDETALSDHPFYVRFHQPFLLTTGEKLWSKIYAATELEPLQ